MELADIRTGLEGFVEQLTSQTYIGTYKVQTRSSLLADGLGTRANSIWKMAQYIVATYDNKFKEPIQHYLNGWKALVKIYKNQFLILEIDANNNWQMYDSDCNLLGGNDFIKKYFEEQTRITRNKTIIANDSLNYRPPSPLPHQQIFYGAPGTGKSHTIKRIVEDGNLPHIRTTFHPDSDYSTFVGAYKPTTIDVPMRDVSGHIIVEGGNQVIEKKIIYTFVPQAFLKAYVAAWSNLNEPFFLIIEEINRGNCAQIFGDLFQLLDRNSEGISDYPVTSDDDIRRYLNSKFSALDETLRDNIPNEILSGEEMLLPQNFHIWATMNTSDQSLFPIDSAFKRRWDWTYIPIKQHDEGYRIKIDTVTYDWWGFLEKINQVIGKTTSSEDKKLGYFFVKAENKEIGADKFVSKVLFYLWNDVFKIYGFDNPIFSRGENKTFDFSDFFKKDGTPETSMVNLFLRKLDETIDKDNSFENKPTAEAEPDQPAENEE